MTFMPNLSELIKFKNGCQIKHTNSAGEQKLSSRNITVEAGVYQPLNPGDIIENLDVNENDNVTVEGMDHIGNMEYYSGRYFDWDVTFEPVEYHSLYRIHNPEGYAISATTSNGPIYYYYRCDHLGNNREVWPASYTWGSTTHAAATVQRTQYYPSGLPWHTNTGIGAGVQNRKYNGKEFVEMHGLDEYDSEARWYYPAIMRTTTMDPHCESYYDTSPYAWCGNNPVNAFDPDGRDVLIWYRNGDGGMNSFLYKGGKVNHTNSYVNKVVNALNHNIRNGGGKPSRTAVYDRNLIVSIYETDGKQSSGKGVAYWNPELGLSVDNGNVLSPATGLDHELDHAIQALLNPEQFKNDRNTNDRQYSNKEEKRVITGSELETAKSNGDIKKNQTTRKGYTGNAVVTNGETSTKVNQTKTNEHNKRKRENFHKAFSSE